MGAFACLSLAAAACGTTGNSGAGSGATPVKGGTLTLLGKGDVDHLDTASAYYTVSYTLERAFTRQLVTYPASSDFNHATTVVADMATQVPSKSNGGLSSDGTTYTFHIKQGVKWDTSPSRQVTAQDVILGFKRLCNPASPVGAPGYYETTIVGFKDYCEPMLSIQPTASAIKSYIDSHDIAGIKAVGTSTIVFSLVQPASDFLNIVALPFASAAPAEYLQYVPDSADFRQHTISDGPYKIVKYDAGTGIELDRNPAWEQATDGVRHAYVDHIKVTEALDQNSVQQQIGAGTADMEWDQPPPTADLSQLLQSHDSRLVTGPPGTLNPYMVINLQSPNNRGALQDLRVRQALEYAVDKVAVGQVYGGPVLNTPASQIMFQGNAGYEAFDLYSTPGNKGDAAKAKTMLAAAGWPNGITLKLIYRTNSVHPQVAQTLQASLKNAGINLELQPVPPSDFYSRYLDDPGSAKRGVWDIATPGWVPDWYGNDGRTMIQPLFDGRTYGTNTIDYGDYNNAQVNSDIDKALAAATPEEAGKYWHDADMQVMRDAVVVPILSQRTPVFHSSRVKNFIFLPSSQQGDITNVWLSGA
ncbi:MAG: ABC transporter substrate-binding protein [Candidatus Dormibacteraceae bacterium]